jgi:paraquat-inducible protein B
MAKRISPTAIGAFVVCSLAILIVAVGVVGSGRLWRRPVKFVCMFQGNLSGLRVGAPVKVRGVQIGTVDAIRLRLSPSEGRVRPDVKGLWLPVIVELDQSQLLAQGATGEALREAGFQDMLKRGMRAQLAMESILTGLLYIDLDLHPNTPMQMVLVPGSSPYREIPTVPTTMEAMQEKVTDAITKFDEIDFEALALSLTDAAKSIRNLATSPELRATLESLREATRNLNITLVTVRAAVNNANSKLIPLAAKLQDNSEELRLTLAQTRGALRNAQALLDPSAPLAVRLNDTLEQLSNAAQSVGALADYLQQNPSALLRGRYVPDKER